MRVLVTGASGFLGRHIVHALITRGHKVRALVRAPSKHVSSSNENVEVVYGDLRQRDLGWLVQGVDSIVHLAAAVTGDDEFQFQNTVAATENLLEATRQSDVDRFVLCSSFAVYDWSHPRNVLDEETPLEKNLYARDGYAIAKIWQEKLVRRYAEKHRWRLTVLRPGFIWSPEKPWIGGTGHNFGHWHVVIGGSRALPISYVENCAECVAIAVDHPAAVGETFNVIDSERVSAWQYEGEAIRATGTKGTRIYLPYWLGMTVAKIASALARLIFGPTAKLPGLLVPARFRARFRPLQFSSQKAQNLLGWRPRWSFAEAWKRHVDAHLMSQTATEETQRAAAKEVTID